MRRRFKGQRTPQQIYESMERSRIRGEELEAAAVQTQFSKTRMLNSINIIKKFQECTHDNLRRH